MPTLGIITCQILELEFADLLAHDPELARVTVLRDDHSQGLIEAMNERHGFEPVIIRSLDEFRPLASGGLEALVRVMEVGLHSVIKRLQAGVVEAAEQMGRCVDGILLGYGMCGNALNKPDELLEGAGVPVFIPMDEDHPVDDCVGMLIGGRENYYNEQLKVAGTMFMTTGFTRHWKTMMTRGNGRKTFDWDMSKRIFAHYERNLFLPTHILSQEEMLANVEEFNSHHGFRNEVQPGTLDILNATWENAKKALRD